MLAPVIVGVGWFTEGAERMKTLPKTAAWLEAMQDRPSAQHLLPPRT